MKAPVLEKKVSDIEKLHKRNDYDTVMSMTFIKGKQSAGERTMEMADLLQSFKSAQPLGSIKFHNSMALDQTKILNFDETAFDLSIAIKEN